MTWEKVKLENVAEIIAGQSPESQYYNQSGNGLPFFQGKADFGYHYPKVRYWCTEPTKKAQPLDILLSVRAPVGPTNICNVESCIGRGLAAIRTGEKLNYKYLYWWFKSYENKLALMGNGSTFSAITTKVVKDLEIPLPPLHIQEQIADTLDKADALRRKDQELLQKYDELAQAIFYDMFGDPLKNKKGFKIATIEDISTKVTDGEHTTPKRSENGIKLLSARNIKNGYLDFEAGLDYIPESEFNRISKRCNPELNDILISCSGTIGRISAVRTNEKFGLVRSVALVKYKQDVLKRDYLEFFMQTDYFQKAIWRNVNTSTQSNLFTGHKKTACSYSPY
jgi:type I restriction enzyme S subunit